MKTLKLKLAGLFLLLALAAPAATTTPFVGYLTDLIGDNVTNTVTIQAWAQTNVITGVGTNLVASFKRYYYPTNPAGYFTGSLAPGNYKLSVEGVDRSITFGLPSSASTQNLAQLSGVPVYAFQNFTVAQFSDAGSAAYSNANAFLLSSRTNWAWQDVTNLQSGQMPVSALTNVGTAAYSNGTHFLLHSRTNWAWQDVTNLQSAQVPVSVLTNADTMTYSNATTFINFMLTNQAGAIWYGTVFSTNFNGKVGQLTNGTFWSSILVSPTLTNGVNYGNAFRSPGTGSGSEQFGTGATAVGDTSVALGSSANAADLNNIAIGADALATNENAFAIGKSAVASQQYAMAIGKSAAASGYTSLAVGFEAAASVNTATAIGASTTAAHTNSTAVGYAATTTRANQTVLGSGTVDVDVSGNFSVAGNQTNGVVYGTNSFSDIAFRRFAITTLVNGDGNEINVGTNTFIQVSGPTAAFGIMGINAQPNRNGHMVIILNKTGFNMNIQNEAAGEPTATYRIVNMTGADRATTGNGAAILIYSSSESRWQLISLDP